MYIPAATLQLGTLGYLVIVLQPICIAWSCSSHYILVEYIAWNIFQWSIYYFFLHKTLLQWSIAKYAQCLGTNNNIWKPNLGSDKLQICCCGSLFSQKYRNYLTISNNCVLNADYIVYRAHITLLSQNENMLLCIPHQNWDFQIFSI